MNEAWRPRIVVVGLGYVGLPLAVALAKHFAVTGLDIDTRRVGELMNGHDRTREIEPERLGASSIALTSDPEAARGADLYIITVPTPVDRTNRPDLGAVMSATRTVADLLEPQRGAIIVYESTVYPGVTEEVCGPLIESASGLKRGRDFFLGYSPERINPGDRVHTVDKIVKVVAGENAEVVARLTEIYSRVTDAGVFPAASIKAAEAAKVIENAQRDINIAFMNEITRIFADVGLSIWDVLDAAATKWNFLPFTPGLVGGHCIGVDPFYLSHLAQNLGHEPKVILSGRSLNDGMAAWLADRLHGLRGRAGNVLVMGLAFKENVPDLRNSKVADVIARMRWLGHDVTVHDPLASPAEAQHEYGIALDADALDADRSYDLVIAAVAHDQYRSLTPAAIRALVKSDGLLADLKGVWRGTDLGDVQRWTL